MGYYFTSHFVPHFNPGVLIVIDNEVDSWHRQVVEIKGKKKCFEFSSFQFIVSERI